MDPGVGSVRSGMHLKKNTDLRGVSIYRALTLTLTLTLILTLALTLTLTLTLATHSNPHTNAHIY